MSANPVFPTFPELLTEDQAASLLGVAPGTLSVWRCRRRYALPWVRVGRAVRYKREDLLAFIETRTVAPDATT